MKPSYASPKSNNRLSSTAEVTTSTSDSASSFTPNSNHMIKKTKAGYKVESKTHKKNMGTYPTKTAAIKRMMEVEMFKAMDKAGTLRKKK